MQRPAPRRLVPALVLALALAACGGGDDAARAPDASASASTSDATSDGPGDDPSSAAPSPEDTATDEAGGYPVEVSHDGDAFTLDAMPASIVSLSPTATEMLFAIGAGDQVVAADEFSTFPEEAPTTELSGFDPNVESILSHEPDLVVLSGDANDVVASLAEVDVPVILQGSAATLDDTYRQIEALGLATGHPDEASEVTERIRTELDEIADGEAGAGLTYYHELSPDLFTATSSTFIGEVYGLFGLGNIADEADADGTGFPQLSSEYVVDADPDLVFLACTTFCEETAGSFGERDGFGELSAVADGNVVELDEDTSSRWGPRVVDFARDIAAALEGVGADGEG